MSFSCVLHPWGARHLGDRPPSLAAGGAPRHHLLDPRTGQPSVSGLWSVTVAAGTCGQAEVAAKTAFLRGLADGADLLTTHGLAGVLVAADGAWRTAGGWPTMSDKTWDETWMGGSDAQDEGKGL